jgi:hypothetical protein
VRPAYGVTLGALWLVLVVGAARAVAQRPPAPAAPPAPTPTAAAADSAQPILIELRLGHVASRTVRAYQVRTEVLVPLTQVLQLAEIGYRLSPAGRLEATVDPGERHLVVDVQSDTMRYGALRVRLEPEFRLFRDGELYVGAERLGDLLGSPFVVDFAELTVTLADPSDLPVARRGRRAAARAALLRGPEALHPDLLLSADRPRWDGLVFDYSVLAPSTEPVAGSGYTAALGADAFGGSLELGASSIGRAADGIVRIDGSWTGVWRDSRWLQQLRLGDGVSTGRAPRLLRGLSITNAPFIRPSVLGFERYAGELEPGGGWSIEAYRAGELLGFDSADAAGRFRLQLPVRYGENPVDFVAYGPLGEIRHFNQTFRVLGELLPAQRFEYGVSAGSCRSALCRSTGNIDLHYGVTERWTVEAGLDQFWRGTLPDPSRPGASIVLPDLSHPYAAVVGSLTNAWAVTADGVQAAFAHGGLRYEPSIDLRLTADYTRYAAGTVAPILTSPGARSRLSLVGFLRPLPRAGFFYFDGTLDRLTSVTGGVGLVTTVVRVETSTQGQQVRALPFVRVEQDAPQGAPSVTRAFLGVNTFVLPRPVLGPLLGAIWLRTQTEVETDGPVRLSAYSVLAARPVGRGLRVETGVSWLRGSRGPVLSLTLTSYLSGMRSYTTLTAPTGGVVSGSQYVQGSLLWDRATGRLATAPGPSLERSGVSGRVFLDENANGIQDPGEPGLAGVRVRVGTSTAVSDANGEFRVWDIVPFEPVSVQVDSLSLPSPLTVPAFGSALLEPGPNRFRGLNIPVVRGAVVEGRVTRGLGKDRVGVAGATLVLTERKSGARRTMTTFSDGGFYTFGVKPGAYELTVEAGTLASLRASAAPLRFTLGPTATGEGVSGLELELRPKP